ncbi:MAG: META domain-containing protein [Paramuribaculum sp.]|nr:META domain-containing protein [Paramuribaculum sp.]
MKVSSIFIPSLLLVATSCGSNGANTSGGTTDAMTAGISGQWSIENIAFSDSDYIRPAEETPGAKQYITFEDDTYFIQTNCNTMSGTYSIAGDSIFMGDGAMTEMACDNMNVEDALRRIIPHICIIDMENDSVMRLNSSVASEYIVLKKITESE